MQISRVCSIAGLAFSANERYASHVGLGPPKAACGMASAPIAGPRYIAARLRICEISSPEIPSGSPANISIFAAEIPIDEAIG